VQFLFARHFGFCFGVENAIEISYKALRENPAKRILLLSQMIHNQEVNEDLAANGIQSIQDTYGNMLMSWDDITSDDVVIVPAFGTTLEIEKLLADKGVDTVKYNTTCPFVEKVWKRSEQLGKKDHTIIIHGKAEHEETRATFSHTAKNSPAVIIKDMAEAIILGKIISGELPESEFENYFRQKSTDGFIPAEHLQRIGVVNQTTMLATETQAIAEHLREAIIMKYGEETVKDHFADTRDTLCYATNDNQSATIRLLEEPADLALVVGGYNSSNTSHIVELCEERLPTFFIKNETELLSATEIQHFDFRSKQLSRSADWLPSKRPLRIVLTSGASCPDTLLDRVLKRVIEFVGNAENPENAVNSLLEAQA
jgi:4-hydroxy-3-methylbut-2-enyl diphosphate reductase